MTTPDDWTVLQEMVVAKARVLDAARSPEPPFWYASRLELVTPRPFLARDRALAAIDRYRAEELISQEVAHRGKELIYRLFERETVYTTVGPDNGGLVFYWRAGGMTIEIDVYEDPRDGYWWRISNVAAVSDSGHHAYTLPPAVMDRLKESLRYFSKEVDRVNRDWRKQQL